jgi:hypothetical protein
MRKTFCDRCGAECTNTTGHIGGHIEHTTSQGETVGIDEIASADLCRGCINDAVKFFHLKVMPQEMEKLVHNTFDGGAVRGFDNITVSDAHYVGPDSQE